MKNMPYAIVRRLDGSIARVFIHENLTVAREAAQAYAQSFGLQYDPDCISFAVVAALSSPPT